MQLSRAILMISALGGLALAPRLAHADDRAMAQQLFEQGRELLAAGKVEEACEKFSGAAQFSATPGVRLNLSDCYAQLGRTASAWAKADEALTMAERSGDSAAASAARERRDALKPKLSYLTIVVSKEAAALPGLEVRRGGEPVPKPAWGVPVPVDPADYEVRVSAPGYKEWVDQKPVAGEGAKVTITVPALERDASGAADGSAGASGALGASSGDVTRDDGGSSWSDQRYWAVGVGGAGIVAMGVGGILGLTAKSMYTEAEGEKGSARVQGSQDAVSRGNVATVVVGVGAALAATGVVLWFTAPSEDVSVGTNGSTLLLRGRF